MIYQKNQQLIFKTNINCISLDNGSPIDCTSLHNINCGLPSGLYRVRLPYLSHVTVFCDMDKDGGGWTVVTNFKEFFRYTKTHFYYINIKKIYLKKKEIYQSLHVTLTYRTNSFFSVT